jgi:hypothetical protein
VTFDERQQFLLLRESFADDTLLADLTASFDLSESLALTSITSYINRDIVVSRDASALTGSVSVDLGYPNAGVLPSLEPGRYDGPRDVHQEVRLSTDSDGMFNFVVGAFYADTSRFYRQRLPTPGYDVVTDECSVPAPRSRCATASRRTRLQCRPALRHPAVRGVRRGDVRHHAEFRLTAGGRYYDSRKTREFISGGLFSNGDNRHDETSSNGFSPR